MAFMLLGDLSAHDSVLKLLGVPHTTTTVIVDSNNTSSALPADLQRGLSSMQDTQSKKQ